MRRALQLPTALALSLVVHAALGVGSTLLGYAVRQVLKPPIQVEILPPKKKTAPSSLLPEQAATPPPPVEAPPPKPRPKSSVGGLRPRRPEDKKPPTPPRDPTPPVTPLSGLGPGDIDQDLGVRVLLRMDALRRSPHRAGVERLLNAFPDSAILPLGTPLAAPGAFPRFLVDELQSLLIATARPNDLTATVFLAAYDGKRDVAARLQGRTQWADDPRVLRVLAPGLLAFARPELLLPAPPTSQPPGAAPIPPSEPSATVDAAWAERLRATLLAAVPAVSAELLNVRQRARFGEGLPTPTAVRLALSADAEPLVHGRIELATPDEATRLAAALPEIRERMNKRLFWVGLGGLLSELVFTARGTTVEITGKLPAADTDLMLAQLGLLLPAPPPGTAPPVTPPTAPVVPDAGEGKPLARPDAGATGGQAQ